MAYRRFPQSGRPQSLSAPQFAPAARKDRPAWLMPVLVVLAVLVLGGLYILTSSDAEVHTFAFTRDATEAKPAPDTKTALTDRLILRLRNGDGVEVRFAETYRGETIWKEEFKLSRWNRLEKVIATRPTRTDEVHKLVAKFEEAAKEWTKHHPLNLVYEVALDTSSGVSAETRKLVFDRIDKVGIADRLRAGDNIELYTFQFGAEDYLHYDTTVVTGRAGYTGITRTLTDLTTQRGASTSTSLAAALFNAFGKNQGKKYRTFAIFSDGLQNGEGIDFYKNAPKPEEFDKIFAALQKDVQCPDLTGTWVYWYFPKTQQDSHQIRAAREFWRQALTTKGAEIKEMEY